MQLDPSPWSEADALLAETVASGKFSMFSLEPMLTTELYCHAHPNFSLSPALGVVCSPPPGFPI